MCVRSRHGISVGAIVVALVGMVLSTSCAESPGSPAAPSARAADSASAASPASTHLGLLLTKTCNAIDHCTVITSSSGPIPVGSDIHYFGPLLETRTTSRIVVTTPSGDTATGNCSLSYKTFAGTCVLTSGTGRLAGLHANVKVSGDFEIDPAGVFTWEGSYHFER